MVLFDKMLFLQMEVGLLESRLCELEHLIFGVSNRPEKLPKQVTPGGYYLLFNICLNA